MLVSNKRMNINVVTGICNARLMPSEVDGSVKGSTRNFGAVEILTLCGTELKRKLKEKNRLADTKTKKQKLVRWVPKHLKIRQRKKKHALGGAMYRHCIALLLPVMYMASSGLGSWDRVAFYETSYVQTDKVEKGKKRDLTTRYIASEINGHHPKELSVLEDARGMFHNNSTTQNKEFTPTRGVERLETSQQWNHRSVTSTEKSVGAVSTNRSDDIEKIAGNRAELNLSRHFAAAPSTPGKRLPQIPRNVNAVPINETYKLCVLLGDVSPEQSVTVSKKERAISPMNDGVNVNCPVASFARKSEEILIGSELTKTTAPDRISQGTSLNLIHDSPEIYPELWRNHETGMSNAARMHTGSGFFPPPEAKTENLTLRVDTGGNRTHAQNTTLMQKRD